MILRQVVFTFLGLLVFVLTPRFAAPHGQVLPGPPDGWSPARPEWDGADAFLAALGRMDSTLAGITPDTMTSALAHLRAAHEATARGEGDVLGLFHRQQAEDLFRAALDASPAVVVFDYTTTPYTLPDRESPMGDGGTGTVLLRVTSPGEGVAFRVQTHDLRSQVEAVRSFPIPVAATGTTYVLLSLPDVPVGESWHHISFLRDGDAEPFIYDALLLRVPEKGTLRVTVQTDGAESPWCLVRLTCLASGRVFRPSDSLDLRDIMDDIAGYGDLWPAGSFAYQAPGPASGVYWINEGAFEMTLPPGRYEVRVHKGPEFNVAAETVEVRGGELTACTPHLARWINMPELGWYSGDDHVHGEMLDSEDVRRVLAFTLASDTHVVNLLEMGNDRRTFYEQRGFGEAFRVQSGNHVLVPGHEDPRYQFGHAIGLNMTARVRDLRFYSLNDLWAEAIREQGGLYGHAHVGHKAFDIVRDMTMMIPRGKSDFSTIMQGILGTELYYDFLDLGYQHAASAGTDTPYGAGIGSVRVYCHTGTAELDVDAWFDALVAGRSFVTQGPMLLLEVDGQMPGATLRVEKDSSVRARVVGRGMPGGFAPAEITLVMNSREVARVRSEEEEAVLEADVAVGGGGWLVATLKDAHGALAHTSPVYLEVEGLRHWNYERVPELIAARRATLDEIEGLIVDIETRQAESKLWLLDFWAKRVLDNADDLRARLAIVRGLMDELEQTHAREKHLRADATP
jgi:hypothetical protein